MRKIMLGKGISMEKATYPKWKLSQNKRELSPPLYPYGQANKHGVTSKLQDTYLFLGTKHSEDLKPEDGSYTEIFSVKQALTLNSRYCLAIAETNLKSSPTPNQIDSNCCTEVLAEGKICLFFRHRKYLPKSLLYYTRCISSYKNYKAYNKASKSNPSPREKVIIKTKFKYDICVETI